jgi:hypothetical protein
LTSQSDQADSSIGPLKPGTPLADSCFCPINQEAAVPADRIQTREAETESLAEVNGPDEVEEILSALRGLLARAANPVLQVCPEGVIEDIEHLAGRTAA